MITKEEMLALEKSAMDQGVSESTLMENAGSEVARVIKEKEDLKGKRVLVCSYHGNNGGDGFVVAHHLASDAEVEVLFVGEGAKLKEVAKAQFNLLESNDRVQFIALEYVDFNDYDIIVDALLGTGSSGALQYPITTVVDFINGSSAKKYSVDVPTGLNPDTGEVVDKVVNADCIVTFHDLKAGLQKMKEKSVVVDIGIPKTK